MLKFNILVVCLALLGSALAEKISKEEIEFRVIFESPYFNEF